MLASEPIDKQPQPDQKSTPKSGPSFSLHKWQSRAARAGLLSIITRSLGTLVAAFGVLICASQFVAAATTVDFYVYEGSQSGPGFTSGSTVTVSTAENELSVCINTPSGTAPNITYTPNCNTSAAPSSGLSDGNKYTAVAYIGTYEDGNSVQYNMFAVGDDDGNVYIMYPTVNSGGDPQTMVVANTYTYKNCVYQPCGRVSSLAKDPSSSTLYISFANISEKNANEWSDPIPLYADASYSYNAPTATLMVTAINSDGSLAAAPTNTYQNWVWQDFGNTYGINGNNTFDYVSPKLRVYPPDYPGLSGTDYFSTGAVFYSGIIGSQNNTAKPTNMGYLCSGSQCEVSFNITLEGTGFSVMTSAEYGVDNRGGSVVPVLYWNQVGATWAKGPSPTCRRRRGRIRS